MLGALLADLRRRIVESIMPLLADTLATAAFVLGPEKGLDLLDRVGVEGLMVTEKLAEFRTRALGDAA